ncbi:MAG: cytochrome c biogenesis protein CcdA [Clostridium sp.]|nr:cytochrome c biogenesis protein CcdA [Clostridium sp.]MDU7082286.1 cytochrome c biogenesis protein CcdA [Clostridium sp.]
MEYILLFLEGIITFISPCILPMLPIYISYFAGGDYADGENRGNTLKNSIGFVIGFTIVFTLLGTVAGTLGNFIKEYYNVLNIIGGVIIVIFGLNYIGLFKIGFLERSYKMDIEVNPFKFLSAIVFGMVFAVGWTPCVGTFLGSALMIAANSQSIIKGTSMLLVYSIGLGIPFIISAVLIGQLKETMNFIKKNYKIINFISGIILIAIGIAMMTGYLNRILSILSS